MKEPIHTCMTKAVISEGDQLRCGPRWIAARRARLRLYGNRLECGNWTVGYEQIRDAVLTSFRSPILRIPGYVLSVRTDANTYHFGLNGWRYWRGELPFPVTPRWACPSRINDWPATTIRVHSTSSPLGLPQPDE